MLRQVATPIAGHPLSGWGRAVAQLTALLACVALATGRLGLIAHELVGHGGTALVVGGRILGVKLFWFAGGLIRYDLDDPSLAAQLAVSMGGIAIEIAVGGTLWLAVRGDGLARRLVRGVGATLVLHALWYFATGAWHGYGDGVLLYRELGDARIPVAIAAGVVACAVAFALARGVIGAIVAAVPGRRIAGAAIAMAIAAGVNIGLAVGELAIRPDATYGAIMTHERDREIARELARWLAEQKRAGVEVGDAARQQQMAQLESEHRTFPFRWLLAGCVLASLIAGALRTQPRAPEFVSRRLLVTAIAIAALSIVAVIVLDAAFAV
jgi:hypothetical protein